MNCKKRSFGTASEAAQYIARHFFSTRPVRCPNYAQWHLLGSSRKRRRTSVRFEELDL